MSNSIKAVWPVLAKVVLPAVVTTLGTMFAALDSELFLRFCGVR